MRFRLEASPDELEHKGDALIKALAARLQDVAPDLAERLEKALPPPEQTLKYPAMQQLADLTREEYARTLERMVEEIGQVLNRSTKPDARYIEKSEDEADELEKAAGPFIGPKGGKWADPQHTIPWHEPKAAAPGEIDLRNRRKLSEQAAVSRVSQALRAGGMEAAIYRPKSGDVRSGFKVSLGRGGIAGVFVQWEPHGEDVTKVDFAGRGKAIQAALKDAGLHAEEVVEGGGMWRVTFPVQAEQHEMDLEKASAASAPFIGPRGGKWADAAHTTAWTPRVIQGEKREPAPETPKLNVQKLLEGNYGIPRIEMPQIRSDLVPDFIQKIRDRGVKVERGLETVSKLRATQSELHTKGVEALLNSPEARPKLSKPVIVSRDGFILDGHHRWAALTTLDPDAKIETVRVDIPIGRLIAEARAFHGVEFKKADEPDEPFFDYTEPIAVRDGIAFRRIKGLVLRRTEYTESDFDEGGPLYGKSNNELLDIVRDHRAPDLQKAGPYIGPRGGKWADPQHTVSWDPSARPAGLHSAIEALGGKVRPHETDTSKVVLKVPHQHAKKLEQIREAHGITDPIKTGEKYTLLAVPKGLAHVEAPVPAKPEKVKAPPKKKAEKPPYAKSDWKPHASVDEAKSWALSKGIAVGYHDIATANQLNEAISEQHPMVTAHAEFLGTPQQLRVWALDHPEVVERAKADAKHKADLTQFKLGGSAIAIAHPTTGKPYSKSVVVVAESWGTAEQYDQKAKAFKSGFTLGNELRDTVRHEFGHVEGFIFRHLHPEKGGPSVWEIWKKHCVAQLKKNAKQVMKDVSEYGATNPHECWAEVSVMRRRGMPVAPWIQAAIDEMKVDTLPWEQMGKVPA